MYAKHMLYCMYTNPQEFTQAADVKQEENSPGVYKRYLHFTHQTVALIFNENDNTIRVIVLNGYNQAETIVSIDDYTPEDNPSGYVLVAQTKLLTATFLVVVLNDGRALESKNASQPAQTQKYHPQVDNEQYYVLTQ